MVGVSQFEGFGSSSQHAEFGPRIVRNRCVPVCGCRAGYFGLGLAQLEAKIRLDIEDFRLDPQKCSGSLQHSRDAMSLSTLELILKLVVDFRLGSRGDVSPKEFYVTQ